MVAVRAPVPAVVLIALRVHSSNIDNLVIIISSSVNCI